MTVKINMLGIVTAARWGRYFVSRCMVPTCSWGHIHVSDEDHGVLITGQGASRMME